MRKRNGFTLIEFAMVTLILGVAVVITIPVVLESQSEARQLGCASRMSDLAKAVLSYEQSNGRLPPAGLVGPGQNNPRGSYDERSGNQISWIVLTLPFLDQADRFDAFNLKQTAFDQSDAAIGTIIGSLQCPTDTQGASFFRHDSGRRFALGNYVAFVSPVHGENEEDLPGALGGFEPGTTEGQRLAEISDGGANTLMLTEVRRRPADTKDETPDQRGAWTLPWMASTILSPDVHGESFSQGPYVPAPNTDPETVHLPNSQSIISDLISPCSRPAQARVDNMPCTRSTTFTAASPRSLHDGGVNMAYVDGRVKFVTNDIDYVLYANLISSDNGRPIIKESIRPLRRKRGNGRN